MKSKVVTFWPLDKESVSFALLLPLALVNVTTRNVTNDGKVKNGLLKDGNDTVRPLYYE